MLSKSFNKEELFESIYRMNECGGWSSFGRCGSSDYDTSNSHSDVYSSHNRSPAENKKILNGLLKNQKLKDAGATEKYIKQWWRNHYFYSDNIDEMVAWCLRYWNENKARKEKAAAQQAELDRIQKDFNISYEQIEFAKSCFSQNGFIKKDLEKAKKNLEKAEQEYKEALANFKSWEDAAGGKELWDKIFASGFEF